MYVVYILDDVLKCALNEGIASQHLKSPLPTLKRKRSILDSPDGANSAEQCHSWAQCSTWHIRPFNAHGRRLKLGYRVGSNGPWLKYGVHTPGLFCRMPVTNKPKHPVILSYQQMNKCQGRLEESWATSMNWSRRKPTIKYTTKTHFFLSNYRMYLGPTNQILSCQDHSGTIRIRIYRIDTNGLCYMSPQNLKIAILGGYSYIFSEWLLWCNLPISPWSFQSHSRLCNERERIVRFPSRSARTSLGNGIEVCGRIPPIPKLSWWSWN